MGGDGRDEIDEMRFFGGGIWGNVTVVVDDEYIVRFFTTVTVTCIRSEETPIE